MTTPKNTRRSQDTKLRSQKRSAPDIQQQLHYHVLASNAARRGKALVDAGDAKAARKALREAEQHERQYRHFGGTAKI